MKVCLFFLIISLTMIQCNGQNSNNVIYLKGFNEKDKLVSRIFVIDKSNIFVCAENINYDNFQNINNAEITHFNEQGIVLKTQTFGKGVIADLTTNQDELFLITNVSSPEAYGLVDSSVLFISTNKGKDWNKVYTFPFLVAKIFFTKSNEGYAICRDQKGNGHLFIMYTQNGKEWKKIFEKLDSTISVFEEAFADEHSVDLLTIDIQNKARLLSIKKNLIDSLSFTVPVGFSIYSVLKNDSNELLLLGTEENLIKIYRFNGQKMEVISSIMTSYSPKAGSVAFNLHNETINVVANKITGVGTNTKVFQSNNYGSTWNEVTMSLEDRFSPYFFYKDIIYGYAGLSRVQIVK